MEVVVDFVRKLSPCEEGVTYFLVLEVFEVALRQEGFVGDILDVWFRPIVGIRQKIT